MTNTDTHSLHVVLGQGQIGTRIRDILLAAGHHVRVVRQSPAGAGSERLEHKSGDISDLAFAEDACRGAAVVYDCMNPPYHRWPELLMPVARGALHGATKAGAKLVAMDNLYMYGRPSGPMREDTPMNPCSKKGQLRAELANLRLEAGKRDLRVTIGRASDFFGPALQYSAWSERFFQRILAGKAGECTGNPDMPHAYTYADDVARGLLTLGAHSEADGKVWHLPTNPAESTRQLTQRVGTALGIKAEVKRVPGWLLKVAGVFSPMMRELPEMSYQWEVPYELDDSRFRAAFGYGPTPIDEQVRVTTDWARAKFAAKAH